jgi:hypothetical protein
MRAWTGSLIPRSPYRSAQRGDAMQGYVCDRCAIALAGRPDGSRAAIKSFPTESWLRTLKSVTVAFLIEPHGDPSGHQGVELCRPCVMLLLRVAMEELLASDAVDPHVDSTGKPSTRDDKD